MPFGVDPIIAQDIADRVVEGIMDRGDEKCAEDISEIVRTLRQGQFAKALCARLHEAIQKETGNRLFAAVNAFWNLPSGLVDRSMLTAIAAARNSTTRGVSWAAAYVHLLHCPEAERVESFGVLRSTVGDLYLAVSWQNAQRLIDLADDALNAALLSCWRNELCSINPDIRLSSAAMLVRHGSTADRKEGFEALISAICGEVVYPAILSASRLGSLGVLADTPEIMSVLEDRFYQNDSEVSSIALSAWTEIRISQNCDLDLSPLELLVANPRSSMWEEAARIVLKHGDQALRKRVRSKIQSRLVGENSGEVIRTALLSLEYDSETDCVLIAVQLNRILGKLDLHKPSPNDPGRLPFNRLAGFLGKEAWTVPRLMTSVLETARGTGAISADSLHLLAELLRNRPEISTVPIPSVTELAGLAIKYAESQNDEINPIAILPALRALSHFPELRVAAPE